MPVLGLIFLRFAEYRFSEAAKAIETEANEARRRRAIGKADYQAKGVLYIPEEARYSRLLKLAEGQNIGRAINEAMRAIEAENEDLKGVLPREYNRLDNDSLFALLKTFSEIAMDFDGDVFGRIYDYFLGRFALAEGQKGGDFYTPASLVKLIVEVIEPYDGRIYDPACGSGGMFVQSANFVARHRENPSTQISIYGQEKVAETIKLCRLNLAVHGLSGDIKQANAYYEDIHRSIGKFDFVMANPPFNVDGVLSECRQDVVEGGHVFGLADVHPAMRVGHAAAGVLGVTSAAGLQERAEVLLRRRELLRRLQVWTESRSNDRVFHVHRHDFLHQRGDTRRAAKTVEQGSLVHVSARAMPGLRSPRDTHLGSGRCKRALQATVRRGGGAQAFRGLASARSRGG